jgi:hypothetical protein
MFSVIGGLMAGRRFRGVVFADCFVAVTPAKAGAVDGNDQHN